MPITRAKTGEAIIDGVLVPEVCVRAYDALRALKRPSSAPEIFDKDAERDGQPFFASLGALHNALRRLESRGLIIQRYAPVRLASGKLVGKVVFSLSSWEGSAQKRHPAPSRKLVVSA